MKAKKLRRLIQHPLRFHHQDIHEELEVIKSMIAIQTELIGKILSKIDDEESDPYYEKLEKEFLGDIDKGTGIYALEE